MRIAHCLLAVAGLAVAGLAGCSSDATVATAGPEATQQTTVVRYTAKDIAALPLGEFVQFDLTRENTVYALTYSNPSDLDHVLVTRSDGQYILGEQLPAEQDVQSGPVEKEIVITNDTAIQGGLGEVACNCPCCQLVDGRRVCC